MSMEEKETEDENKAFAADLKKYLNMLDPVRGMMELLVEKCERNEMTSDDISACKATLLKGIDNVSLVLFEPGEKDDDLDEDG